MSLTDPIADALTILRNASRAHKEAADVRASRITGKILEIFKKERFISDFRFIDDKKQGTYKVYMKYHKGKVPAITNIKRSSLPGRRCYVPTRKLPRVYGGMGVAIISTPKGILSDEEARNLNVGGELICEVW